MPGGCEVRVRLVGPAVVLSVGGEVDLAAGDVLLSAYDRAAEWGGRLPVVLDFAGVGSIDPIGIAVIVTVLARARTQDRTVVACGLPENSRELFAVTRLAEYLPLYADLGRALDGLAGPAPGRGGA